MTMLTVDLRKEAAAEADRLVCARVLTHEEDEHARWQRESDSPWMAVARGSNRRRRLGMRVLLLWRLSLEDGTGRRVESRLVGVAIPASRTGRLRRRADVDAFLRARDAEVRARLAAACQTWHDDALAAARAFGDARASRERAIAAHEPDPGDAFQPGLFDARAQRGHAIDLAAREDAARRAAERRGASDRAATLVARPAELLLVLLP